MNTSPDDLRRYAAHLLMLQTLRAEAARLAQVQNSKQPTPLEITHLTIPQEDTVVVNRKSKKRRVVINVDSLTIRAGSVVLDGTFSPIVNLSPVINVPEIVLPTPAPVQVNAVVHLPPRKERTVTIDGPEGEYTATLGGEE